MPGAGSTSTWHAASGASRSLLASCLGPSSGPVTSTRGWHGPGFQRGTSCRRNSRGGGRMPDRGQAPLAGDSGGGRHHCGLPVPGLQLGGGETGFPGHQKHGGLPPPGNVRHAGTTLHGLGMRLGILRQAPTGSAHIGSLCGNKLWGGGSVRAGRPLPAAGTPQGDPHRCPLRLVGTGEKGEARDLSTGTSPSRVATLLSTKLVGPDPPVGSDLYLSEKEMYLYPPAAYLQRT